MKFKLKLLHTKFLYGIGIHVCIEPFTNPYDPDYNHVFGFDIDFIFFTLLFRSYKKYNPYE